MKKIMMNLMTGLLAMTVAVHGLSAQQANDPEAKKILDAVSAEYRSYDAIKANFSYMFDSPSENGSNTQEGVLYVRPGGDQYKILIDGQEIISDGVNSWVYLKEVNEVQVSKVRKNEGDLNPSQLFTIHEKGFKYRLKGDGQIDGKPVHLIDLVPVGPQEYSRIELAVGKDSARICQLKIFDKNGSHYSYRIKDIDVNPGLASDFFSFDREDHPGVEVVDLR